MLLAGGLDDADGLALEQSADVCHHRIGPGLVVQVEPLAGHGQLLHRSVLHDQEGGDAAGVWMSEVHHLLARLVDAERHDKIELAGIEARDDARPFVLHELARHLGAPAEIIGDVDVETPQLAVRTDRVPRREGAFDTDPHRRPVLG